MSGFQSPNYTQTPNDFFEMIPNMSDAEIRVTLIMIRQTFGFHRDGFKMGINKLANAAGLSRNGAKDGAEAAEKRGTFRRINPEAQTEAEWELSVTPSTSDLQPSQPVTTPPSASDSQVRVKEKKINKRGDLVDGILAFSSNTENDVENLMQEIERGLKVNITRSTKNQAVAKRILRDARPFGQWLTWCMSDEWRATHLYLYADLEKVWRDYPQAFGGSGNNPLDLEVGI